MPERENVVKIQNLEVDSYASIMLDDLKEQLCRCNGFKFVKDQKVLREDEKCDLTLALSFVVSVAAGVVGSAIYDYLKSVFSHHRHPKNYQWKLIIQSDECMAVTVDQKDGVVSVDIQKIDLERLLEE